MKLAASFFVALVGMIAWNQQQRSEIGSLADAGGQCAHLRDRRRRARHGRARADPAGRDPDAGAPSLRGSSPAYRLTIRDAATGGILGPYELRLNRELALTLSLPEGLAPGRYRMELADGAGKVLETYLLRVAE